MKAVVGFVLAALFIVFSVFCVIAVGHLGTLLFVIGLILQVIIITIIGRDIWEGSAPLVLGLSFMVFFSIVSVSLMAGGYYLMGWTFL